MINNVHTKQGRDIEEDSWPVNKYYTTNRSYVTGLNECKEFNPNNTPNAKGITFVGKEVLYMLHSENAFIREVTIPPDTKILPLLHGGSVARYITNKVILGPEIEVNCKIIETLIKEGASINSAILNWAAGYGKLDVIKLLITYPGIDIHYNNEDPLYEAIKANQFAVIKFLIEKGADMHVHNNFFLKDLCKYANSFNTLFPEKFTMVKFLLEHLRNKIDYNFIRRARYAGNHQLVKIFLEQRKHFDKRKMS